MTSPPPAQPISARAIFARNFRAARRRSGLTQADIARRTGIARPSISSLERGADNITLESADRLALAVGVSLSKLLTP